jgi:hypothetical protein
MSIKNWLKIVSLKTTLQNYKQTPLIGKGLVFIVINGLLQEGFGKNKLQDYAKANLTIPTSVINIKKAVTYIKNRITDLTNVFRIPCR